MIEKHGTGEPADLIEHPEQLTPEWLTGALAERHPGARVAGVEVLEIREGTNSNARIRVRYGEPAGLPEALFLKLPPLEPERRALLNATGMGRREAHFYRHLADRVPMRVPTPYVALLDPSSGAFVLVIEDLEAAGCTLPDGVDGIRFEQAASAVRDLAGLHVRYEDPALREREAGWCNRMERGSTFGTSMLQFGLDHHRDELTDAFAEMAQLYIDRQSELEDVWDEGPVTVLQGDGHIGNLFEDGERVGFFDWGLVQLGNPMRDVCHFINHALSPGNRRKHEHELIRRYLEARRECGGEEISFDDAWRWYRLHASYAAPSACPTVLFPPDETPERRRQAGAYLERSACAIEDLDARGALREYAGI